MMKSNNMFQNDASSNLGKKIKDIDKTYRNEVYLNYSQVSHKEYNAALS